MYERTCIYLIFESSLIQWILASDQLSNSVKICFRSADDIEQEWETSEDSEIYPHYQKEPKIRAEEKPMIWNFNSKSEIFSDYFPRDR